MGLLQQRLTQFVKWIKPEPETHAEIVEHAEAVLTRLKNKAIEQEIPVIRAVVSGSLKKETGLRRHLRGDSVVEGQDVDLAFIVDSPEKSAEMFEGLLVKFDRVVRACYPNTDVEKTKSSVKLMFQNPLLSYDVVPFYDMPNDYQILIRRNYQMRITSLSRHVQFIATRTAASKKIPGRVTFNECVRLLKWWRCHVQAQSSVLEDIPSMLIDLICAKAFDECGVQADYAATLTQWMHLIAHKVKTGKAIYFNDFGKAPKNPPTKFAILDPVNDENDLTAEWGPLHRQEFSNRLLAAADELQAAMAADDFGDDGDSLDHLANVFGPAIKNLIKETE